LSSSFAWVGLFWWSLLPENFILILYCFSKYHFISDPLLHTVLFWRPHITMFFSLLLVILHWNISLLCVSFLYHFHWMTFMVNGFLLQICIGLMVWYETLALALAGNHSVVNQQLLWLQVLIIGEYWYSRVEKTHYIKVKCRNAYTLLTQACVGNIAIEEGCPLETSSDCLNYCDLWWN
jgi:hypothetical protein